MNYERQSQQFTGQFLHFDNVEWRQAAAAGNVEVSASLQ